MPTIRVRFKSNLRFNVHAFSSDHTIYHSMQNLDCNAVDGIPQYEFFRQKAWHCKVHIWAQMMKCFYLFPI